MMIDARFSTTVRRRTCILNVFMRSGHKTKKKTGFLVRTQGLSANIQIRQLRTSASCLIPSKTECIEYTLDRRFVRPLLLLTALSSS